MGGGQVSFRFLNKPTLNSTFYVFCCLLLLKLCINLVLLSCADKKVTKEARKQYLHSLTNCNARPERLNSLSCSLALNGHATLQPSARSHFGQTAVALILSH